MQHRLPLAQLQDDVGAFAEPMAEAVSRCVHCGFCLADCPTYRVTGEEAESPRGRIFLMKEALEGSLEVEAAARHVDGCLGCLACVTSCPSGVEYGELMVPFRAWSSERRATQRGFSLERLQRRAMLATLTVPSRLRWALRLGRLAKPLRSLLPASLRTPLELLPTRTPHRNEPIPSLQGERRARVGLLRGCAQSLLEPAINAATKAVYARNGIEVIEPEEQGCCGALDLHAGELEAARRRAAPTVLAFARRLESGDIDAVVTTAAGCGSAIHEYPLLFGGTDLEAPARAVAAAAVDCTTFLAGLGMTESLTVKPGRRVAVHDACHLGHAQRETAAPRTLLRAVEGIELVEPGEAAVCCGSAGIYNLEHPEMAAELGRRKCAALEATGAEWIATGNIGCLTQIRHHLTAEEVAPRVLHTLQILEVASPSSTTARRPT
ncbi:MAG: heterodisulfide reductase-related iron-sulfur binding cluster [Acidobacteriota bacterium]